MQLQDFTKVAFDYNALDQSQIETIVKLTDTLTIQRWIDSIIVPPITKKWKEMKQAYYWSLLTDNPNFNLLTPINRRLTILQDARSILQQLHYPTKKIETLEQYHQIERQWAEEVITQATQLW